jgi:predicted O-methyltransferase YrrM
MMSSRNRAIKNYLNSLLLPDEQSLNAILHRSKDLGLPPIHVSPQTGKFLYLLAKIHGSKKILEIGTLGGYSTAWLAKALPKEGEIITIDCFEQHLKIAAENLSEIGLRERVLFCHGVASQVLPFLEQESFFDFVFIDADKSQYPLYLKLILPLMKKGGLIVSDNLIPKEEEIGRPSCEDKEATAIYQFNELVAAHPELESVFVTTLVGQNGRIDALGISRVRD